MQGCCCDTTSSNLGHLKGAATILEQLLERELEWFPCRHHIDELSLKGAFEAKMPASTSPNVEIFKRFRESWSKLDHSKFKPGIKDKIVKKIMETDRSDIIKFVNETLQIQQPREDYEEFLLVTLLFLGEPLPPNKSIRAPGAFHHARWMAKAIYTLKIFLFRDNFQLTRNEKINLRDICIFIVKLYLKKWFSAPLSTKAPAVDLNYVKQLIEYRKVDAAISEAVLSKVLNHLWYLSPENCGLAFFDDDISPSEKIKMVKALDTESSFPGSLKRIKISDASELNGKEIHNFVCRETRTFFQRFNLSTDFLGTNPETWHEIKEYKEDCSIVRKIKVVNDCSERAIKLIDEYEKLLTKDEEERLAIIQTVAEYRKRFKKVTKGTMKQAFSTSH